MIISFFVLSIVSLVILGYSCFLKSLINSGNIIIKNYDFVYGLLLISLISIIFNFFFQLNYLSIPISILGLFLFIFYFYKKKIEINFIFFFLILFLFIFFTHNNSLNYDSPFYHLQIIKWSSDYKIPFGLINLEQRFAMPSIWHIFLSPFSFDLFNFNPIYLISLIPFSFLINQVIENRNLVSLSNFYLFFFVCILLIFSLIHPFQDGIIFNHLGSPESDIIGIVFFGFSFYFFLRFLDNKNDKNFYYITLFVFFGILTKISYFYLFFLFIIPVFFLKFKIFNNYKIYFFLIFFISLWFLRNIIVSGCLIFPISFTCFDFPWSNNIDQVEYFFNEAKSWSRSTRDRLTAGDFDYTLNSFDWFLPWFKDYFLNTSILKILGYSTLGSLIFFLILLFFKKVSLKKIFNRKNSIIFIFFILGIISWLQSPEVRYGHGLLISIIVFNLIIIIKVLDIKNFNPYFKFLPLVFLTMIVIKNFDVLDIFFKSFSHNFDYSNFIKIKNVNNFIIYSPNPNDLVSSDYLKFCGNFEGICGYINHPTNLENLNIEINKFGYFVFSNKL